MKLRAYYIAIDDNSEMLVILVVMLVKVRNNVNNVTN